MAFDNGVLIAKLKTYLDLELFVMRGGRFMKPKKAVSHGPPRI